MKHIIPHSLKAHQFTYSNQMNKFYFSFFTLIAYENCMAPFLNLTSIDSCPVLTVLAFLIPCQFIHLNSSSFFFCYYKLFYLKYELS